MKTHTPITIFIRYKSRLGSSLTTPISPPAMIPLLLAIFFFGLMFLFHLLLLSLFLFLSSRPHILHFTFPVKSQALAFIWTVKMGKRFTWHHLSIWATAHWSATLPEEAKLTTENSIRATHKDHFMWKWPLIDIYFTVMAQYRLHIESTNWTQCDKNKYKNILK